MSKRKASSSSPTAFEASHLSSTLQSLQEFPDIWAGWQKDGTVRQENQGSSENGKVGGNLFSIQALQEDVRLRKSLQNPVFVESLLRLKAEMERTAKSPLRNIVIHYHADEPLYPSEEVMLHFSANQTLQEFLVLCSRQGRIRPEHPEYPLSKEGFTAKVRRNPLLKV